MKYVALLSGGKDSCYAIMECAKMGHEAIAVAHLSPPAAKDELDSFMFQSVGHAAVAQLCGASACLI